MDQRLLLRHGQSHITQGARRSLRRPCSGLLCRAVLNLEPPSTKHQRDVTTQALAAEAALLPLPAATAAEVAAAALIAIPVPLLPELAQQQQQQQRRSNLLRQVLDNGVMAPVKLYQQAMAAHPLSTKACTALVGFVLGDVIAQHFSHPQFVDVMRAARLGLYGLLVDGPAGSVWYDVLEAAVFPEEPTSTKAVLAKTALDQLVYATIMTGVFFALIKAMEGEPAAIIPTIQAKFWPTLAANYLVWPLAHLINFRFVKSEYRILYNNAVCVAWLTFLSLMTHSKVDLLALLHISSGSGH